MQMMNKKILAVVLCLSLCGSLAACAGSDTQTSPENPVRQDMQETAATEQEESREAISASEKEYQEASETKAMTDEELLKALGDNINVIAEDAYVETVNAFLDSTDDYLGQLYQLKGTFVKEGETPCLAVDNGTDKGGTRIPLKCLLEEPEEDSHVRVTGIVNYGDIDGESVPVLDVAVIEIIQE